MVLFTLKGERRVRVGTTTLVITLRSYSQAGGLFSYHLTFCVRDPKMQDKHGPRKKQTQNRFDKYRKKLFSVFIALSNMAARSPSKRHLRHFMFLSASTWTQRGAVDHKGSID